VNAGENVQIFFRANVNSPLPNNSQIVNTAHVADLAGNFTPFDLNAFTTVESSPYLGNSSKDVDLSIAQPGDTLTYNITLVNEGNAVANASLLDTLATELENPVLISWDNGSAEIVGGNQISWTGQITPGQDVVIAFRADLLPVLDNGIEVENTALVDDGVNAAFYIDPPAVTEITSAPDLDTSVKTVDHATASPGDELVYTVALNNTGDMVADTLVRDVLPNNVTFVGGLSATSGAPLPTYSSINNRVSWNGDVAPGTPVTFSYRVQIATPLDDGTVILNDAEIDDGAHTPFETTPPAETTISSAPDLSTSTKWVDRTNASPDDLLHYRVTLINSGDMIATGVSLSDIMPADVNFASGPFVTGNGSGGYNPVQRRVYWNGFVAPGDDVDVDYYVNVNTPLPNGTTIVNDALIEGDDFSDVTTNQVNTTVNSFHEFGLVKNAPSAVAAGGQILYEIDYSVGGNEPANSVTITDSIPANTTYVAASCSGGVTCSESAGVVTWNLGDLVPGDADTVQFTVDVAGVLPDGTIITNTVHIHDADTESEDTAYTEVTSGHWFDVVKTDSVDPVAAGASLTYSVTWTLGGNEQAEDIVVTDTLPAEVSFVSASDGGAETSPGSGIVVWGPFAGPFDPDDSDTLTVLVTVDDPLPNGTPLDNFVEVADDGGVPGSDTEQTTVNSSHTLGVDKTGPSSVEAGGLITYSIDWTVDGNETALGVIIEDTTPVNTTFVSASGAATIDDPGVGSTGMVRWYLGDRTDDSGTVQLVARVDDPLDDGTDVDNLASIRDNNGGATDSDGHTTGVSSAHSFSLVKTAAPPSVPPEGVINYTIHWEVTGNEIAQNVTISDAIPLNTVFENCGACVFLGSYVQWNLGTHAPGDSGDVFFQARVNTPLPNGTIIANTAHVFDTNGGTPQQASDDTTVDSNHTLAIAKSDTPDPVNAGGQIVYTIDWAVYGNEPAPNVVIRDPVPTGASYDSCSGGCTTEGNDVVWYLGDRDPGESGTVQFTVDVDDVLDDGSDIVNVATISDDDTGTADDTATTHTEVESSHAMSVDKSAPATVDAGDTLNYSIDWTLSGNERADNLSIVDTLPDNVSFVSATGGGVHSGEPSGGTVTWDLGERTPADGDT
ncbi:MAG: DUF11 domain-containing protein, partial [Actinomycetia bacterium]|nr:DUF11 domain-containing protein [Actinomycetes bacterium]